LDDLTGIWTGNDNGTYYIRQIANVIWWFARARDGRKNIENEPYYSNVFRGVITSNVIEGEWADVPPGNTTNYGTLRIEIKKDSNDNIILSRIHEEGGFGGSVWEKIKES
jgi:hypothetical protein